MHTDSQLPVSGMRAELIGRLSTFKSLGGELCEIVNRFYRGEALSQYDYASDLKVSEASLSSLLSRLLLAPCSPHLARLSSLPTILFFALVHISPPSPSSSTSSSPFHCLLPLPHRSLSFLTTLLIPRFPPRPPPATVHNGAQRRARDEKKAPRLKASTWLAKGRRETFQSAAERCQHADSRRHCIDAQAPVTRGSRQHAQLAQSRVSVRRGEKRGSCKRSRRCIRGV